MECKMNLAEVFGFAVYAAPTLIIDNPPMNCRTEHRNGDGDVYYLFADGSIYSVKGRESYSCLDSMKDVLLETYGEMQDKCRTLDEVLNLKCV